MAICICSARFVGSCDGSVVVLQVAQYWQLIFDFSYFGYIEKLSGLCYFFPQNKNNHGFVLVFKKN